MTLLDYEVHVLNDKASMVNDNANIPHLAAQKPFASVPVFGHIVSMAKEVDAVHCLVLHSIELGIELSTVAQSRIPAAPPKNQIFPLEF